LSHLGIDVAWYAMDLSPDRLIRSKTGMTQQEILEEKILLALDRVEEQSNDSTTKMIVDLFKSAVLKKYKVAFDQELAQGNVHRKNIDKAVEFCYSDICVSIRQLTNLSEKERENLIQSGKQIKNIIKSTVEQILIHNGIELLE